MSQRWERALHWIGIAVLSVVYGASNLLLALAWRHLLNGFGHRRPVAWTVRVFGISQIAKYLPGNIFHLAGRQAMGMADGLPGWILARSMAWELGLLMLAGCLFLFPLLPLLRPGIPEAALVFAVVISRIVTVCGDTLFYVAAHVQAKSPAESGESE